jgi:poly-gamma-glutamate synthesis protein (capsule biosynthesis protein)
MKLKDEKYSPKMVKPPKNFTSIFDPKKVNFSSHYEDCDDVDVFCKSGFTCKINRCLTDLEVSRAKELGLQEKNACEDDDDCPAEQECIKHRCVDDEDEVSVNKRNTDKDPSVNLLFTGAVFLNGRAYESGSNPDKSFCYDHFFQYIKEDISRADLAVVDQETIFETDKKNFVKRVLNTPTELGDAIARAGFKLVLHGSLYAFAKEEKGIQNTLNFWAEKYPDIKVLGINEDEEDSEEDYYIFKKNGLKIGLVNFYGYEGNMIPEDKQYSVNMLKNETIKELVGKLKNETDFVIVCVNWGDKNTKKPTKKQIGLAKILAEFGANVIIGHHPATALPVSHVESNGKRALVFWSLGQFVTDNHKKYSILGAMANITISKSEDSAYLSAYNLIPTVTHKGEGRHYTVYKLNQYPEAIFKLDTKNMPNVTRSEIVSKCEKVFGGLADCY